MEDMERTQESEEKGGEVSEPEQSQEVSQEGGEVSGEKTSYSLEEVEKLKAGWQTEWQSTKDKELKTIYQERDEALKARQEAERKSADAAREAARQAYEKAIIDEYGDTNEARGLIEARREADRLKDEAEQMLAEAKTQHASSMEQAKIVAAYELAAQFNIDVNLLLPAKTPMEMENIALRQHNKNLLTQTITGTKTRTAQKVDSGMKTSEGQGWEKIRNDFIQHPDDPEVYKRYMEARKARGK